MTARAWFWAGGALLVAAAAVVAGLMMTANQPSPADRGGEPAAGGSTEGRAGTAAPQGDRPEGRPVLVIAHRGASAYAPHDTVAAARAAVRRGADALEVDVRQTRDGRLVALYRPTLAATTNVEQVFPQRAPWAVESFTLAELRRLDAGSWFSPKFRDEQVPTLQEIVAAVEGSDVRVIVEPKSPDRYPGIAARLARSLRSQPDRFLEVECFDWGFLRRFEARYHPPVVLGLTGTPPPRRIDRLTSFADAVNPGLGTVDAGYVERAHAAGVEVKVWSVNEVPAMRRAVEMGVDGIYTHRPDVLQQVLEDAR